jgi:hypothetical protein
MEYLAWTIGGVLNGILWYCDPALLRATFLPSTVLARRSGFSPYGKSVSHVKPVA